MPTLSRYIRGIAEGLVVDCVGRVAGKGFARQASWMELLDRAFVDVGFVEIDFVDVGFAAGGFVDKGFVDALI